MAQAEDAEVLSETPTLLVCVIEDDADIRETLRMLLEAEGYRVSEAADGLDGYALLRDTAEPVIALVDHHLPAMGGCDLLELIAADGELRARHAFIFITGSPRYVVEEDCGEILDELAASVVGKPFDIDEMLAEVQLAAARLSAPLS